MKCCHCKKPVGLGPEHIPVEEEKCEDFAIRCVYCLSVFCVPCSIQHFEARNGGKTQKKVTTTVVTEEWRDVPASAWKT